MIEPFWDALRRTQRLAAVLAGIGWYATRIEPRWLSVRRLVIASPRIPPGFDGCKLVHISDFHLGVRWMNDRLPQVIQAVQRESPDLILFTGDLVTWRRERRLDPARMIADLGRLHAPLGVWAVLGNHDFLDPAGVAYVLTEAGITLLRNETRLLRRNGDVLALAGLDDVVLGRPDLHATLRDVPPETPALLMVHEPDFAQIASVDDRIALQLSGHTHGGQIALLRRFPPVTPRFGKLYVRGYYTVRGTPLIVTTGVGTGRFVMRFNCRPEITVVTLRRPRCNGSVL